MFEYHLVFDLYLQYGTTKYKYPTGKVALNSRVKDIMNNPCWEYPGNLFTTEIETILIFKRFLVANDQLHIWIHSDKELNNQLLTAAVTRKKGEAFTLDNNTYSIILVLNSFN